ncbi:hypothetical protein LOC67_23620 [Stieleria sp. JC731]|uniref:hypothetical protein n=1 Tax=Pirellulaceae TaxID=2691357 RepID=UPI001E31AE9A|nr:hypothetical protein [Stieleria sp. JC731]MCC9603549.1 hypothetical protein [Stieleria sp. JC731]
MSAYGDQPGGGFSSVDGYNDLAGSQAEEQRRMQEDEMNRQRQEQAANDAAIIQAEQQAAYAQQRTETSQARRNERQPSKKNVRQQQRRKVSRVNAAPPSKINPGFALLGFVVAGTWGLGLLEGDGKAFGGIVTGLIGAYVAGHHYKVLIAAVLVGGGWWFLSQPNNGKSNLKLPAIADIPVARSSSVPNPVSINQSQPKPSKTRVASSTAKSASHFGYPAKPSILLRPYQAMKTDPSLMRQFKAAMLEYEQRTGKSFLDDHPSMRQPTATTFDYFSRYGNGKLLDGEVPMKSIQSTDNLWEYSSPQLWEIDLLATVKQTFEYSSIDSSGVSRDGKTRTYPGEGLCYQPMNRPLYRNGNRYTPFQVPVIGGDVWRNYVRSVYQAKTDAELLKLDPFNLAITQTHRDTAKAQSEYELAKRQVDERSNAAASGQLEASHR